ncbi:MAG: hypothetical protein ACKOPS_04690 [Cyanobium sp.]
MPAQPLNALRSAEFMRRGIAAVEEVLRAGLRHWFAALELTC